MFGNNKKKLHQARMKAEQYLNEVLHVRVKDNWQFFRVDDRGVDFVGYRIFREYCLLRKSTSLRIARRTRRMRAKGKLMFRDAAAVMSYLGWLKHCNAHNFMREHLLPVGKTEKLKQIISTESKKNLTGFFF